MPILSRRTATFRLGALLALLAIPLHAATVATVEDPVARAALPEYKYIPAAKSKDLTPAATVDPTIFQGWPRSQGDNGARRYSALKQINKDNVRNLEVAWIYRSGDGAANVQCTPIFVDGILYGPTPGRAIVAIDAATGAERWRFPLPPARPVRLQDAPARRGLVYWPGDRESPPRILFGGGDWIYALDPGTGRPLPGFGEGGRTSIPTGATVAGAVYRDVYVTSGLLGDAYGYDVRTGRMLWRFRSIPAAGEFGAATWDRPQQGANGWGGLSIDDARGIAFVAFGAPRPDMVGVGRLGDNLFSDCVVALEVLTGSDCGTSRIYITTFGISTCARHPTSPPSCATAGRSTSSRAWRSLAT